ncbi:uncharacterized protein LOC117168801 [Belonocnema kinseyi]|uniref:uncharacterized protein LOC117168801 n=1 Tax=Belonocnema kinseyi TaxID=2817044 RepID=UPI00143CE6C0|nr:uncharacterized protein LOC117168801 [Belonocnema kinseyi]XP_033210515.1 uncharacterized protein LOC117168801 [Belonocnema kinseyi]XP_033210517.1 uncharacterized protein LOC117168801 [Belonocnema kinseyi]
MIRTNPKRSATHWRVALLFLGFLGSAEFVRSAPADPEKLKQRTSSLSSPRRSPEQDIGSPSELAWQAWLLVDAQPAGSNTGLDSASIPRRITPKSVFIAPSRQACADGYKADKMGRCQKVVIINREAHFDFIVNRLNQLYGKNPSQAASTMVDKKQSPIATGPLQLNIPLLPDSSQDESSSHGEEEEPPHGAIPLGAKKESSVFNYKRNDTTKLSSEEDYEKSFFLQSNSTDNKKNNQGSSTTAFVVPVVDFIDEANETFPEIVDYNIPHGLQTVLNPSTVVYDSRKEDFSTTEDSFTQEDNAATTTLFNKDQVSDYDYSQENVTVRSDSETENVTESPIRKEIISDDISDIDSEMESWRNESDASSIEGTKNNETTEADVLYEEDTVPDLEDLEEYTDTTQVSEDDTGESEDELLKHGETGMTIPIENQALVRSEKKKTQVPKDDFPMETTTFFEDESDSITTTEGGEDLGSNVSSEVSINKDFVLETTLLDVNTGKVKNFTKPVSVNSTPSKQNSEDDLTAFFEAEKKLITEPEVIFSPQDNRGSSSPYGRKRDGQLLQPNFQSVEKSHNSTIAEPPMASMPFQHLSQFAFQTRPIEEQASFQSERILPPDTQNNFPFRSPNLDPKPPDFGNYRPNPVNRRGQDFVRFPNYQRPREGYIRFPSEEVNSIHHPEIKQRFPYSREDYPSSSTGTKNNISFNQKQSNWWVPSPPRTDRQQTFMEGQTSKNQNPMLLRFWARMPLVRDPSLDSNFPPMPSDQTFEKENISRSARVSSSRRSNFHEENSPHEVKRVFSRNARSSIGG